MRLNALVKNVTLKCQRVFFMSNGVNLCVLKHLSMSNDVNLIIKGVMKFESYPSLIIKCQTKNNEFSIKDNERFSEPPFSSLLNVNEFGK